MIGLGLGLGLVTFRGRRGIADILNPLFQACPELYRPPSKVRVRVRVGVRVGVKVRVRVGVRVGVRVLGSGLGLCTNNV